MPTVEVSTAGSVLVDAAGVGIASGADAKGAALRNPKTTRTTLATSTTKFTQESFFKVLKIYYVPSAGILLTRRFAPPSEPRTSAPSRSAGAEVPFDSNLRIFTKT
jgi:hypothetical protein